MSSNVGKGGHYSTMTTLGKVGDYNFQKQKPLDEILNARRQETGHMLFHQLDDEARRRHAEYEWRYEQFRRKYTSGIPLEQIADELGMKVETLKDRRYLGRLKKRKEFKCC